MKMNRGTLHSVTCFTGSSPLKKGRKVGFYEAVLPDPGPVNQDAGDNASPLPEKLLISWGFSCNGAGSSPGTAVYALDNGIEWDYISIMC